VTPPPFKPDWRALAALGALLILGAWRFFDIIEDMHTQDDFMAMDHAVYLWFQHLRTPGLDQVVTTLTEFGDTLVVTAVVIAVAAWLSWQKLWRTLIYWLLATAGGSAINSAIKLAIHRVRPGDMHYSGVSVFSFPSGHSTTNAVIYGFLAVILMRQVRPKWRIAIAAAAIVYVLLIATSRLYLGAHWFSDVVGGLAFGSLWLALLSLYYLLRQGQTFDPRHLAAVAGGALVVAAGVNIVLHHQADMRRYAVDRCLTHTGACAQQ
jgi:membrane-associated phospholipid phosphatase